jgi:hypothetical protein
VGNVTIAGILPASSPAEDFGVLMMGETVEGASIENASVADVSMEKGGGARA